MRTLGLISIGIAAIGLVAYYFMGESTPAFILPLILASGLSTIFFVLASLIINMIRSQKKYRCLNCGTVIRGGNPIRYGNVCPNCGGNAFK